MRTVLGLLMLLFCSTYSFGGVEVVSLYFEEDNANPTGYTVGKMNQVKEMMAERHIQFIEVNSFADSDEGAERNKQLAKTRLKYVVDFFEAYNENLITNVYGQQKVLLNFKPFNWHRVDIYYYVGDEDSTVASDDNMVIEEPAEVVEAIKVQEVPKLDEITENKPIVLPIKFKEGTFKIKSESEPKLDQLYNTMMKYPQLTVQIRGHVCCKDKMAQSKKRAKVVYSYLKKRGIDKSRISYKGYSNSLPIVYPERTNGDRAANRRVDVVFRKN